MAGGTALLAQKLLEAVFGEDAVRRLAKQAKDLLDGRIHGLMASELGRYEQVLGTVGAEAAHADAVRAAVAGLTQRRGDTQIGAIGRAELESAHAALGGADSPALAGDVLDPVTEGYQVGCGMKDDRRQPPSLALRLKYLDEVLDLARGRADEAIIDATDALIDRAGSGCPSPAITRWWRSPGRRAPASRAPSTR